MESKADHSLSSSSLRACSKCQESKPLTEFYKLQDRLRPDCKVCHLAAKTAYNPRRTVQRKLAPNYKRTNKKSNLMKFGLTLEDYNAMVFQQSGLCKSCGDLVEPLVVDHDHITGKVRFLLCSNCNCALGLLKEDASRIAALLKYLSIVA